MGRVATRKEGRNAFKILTNKPTGKRTLGKPRRRWEDTVRLDLKGIGVGARKWVDSTQDRDNWRVLVAATLKIRVSQGMGLVSILFLSVFFFVCYRQLRLF